MTDMIPPTEAELAEWERLASRAVVGKSGEALAELGQRAVQGWPRTMAALRELTARAEAAEAERDALREIRQRGCECNDADACRFVRERDAAIDQLRREKEDAFGGAILNSLAKARQGAYRWAAAQVRETNVQAARDANLGRPVNLGKRMRDCADRIEEGPQYEHERGPAPTTAQEGE